MDFGISKDDLQTLFREADMQLDEDVVNDVFKAFPLARKMERLNALEFIEGFSLLVKGKPEEKFSRKFSWFLVSRFDFNLLVMYDIFDFQKRSEISFDELVSFLVLCFLKYSLC